LESKKVACIVSSLYGGGAEKSVLTLSRTLNRLGHSSHVVSLEDVVHYDVSAEQNVHVLKTRPENAIGLRAHDGRVNELRERLDQIQSADGRQFDLVIANLLVASNVVSRAGLDNVFHCVHNSLEQTLRQARNRSLPHYLRRRHQLRALDGQRLIAVSRGIRNELEDPGIPRPASVRVIYNAVDTEMIRRRAREPLSDIPDGDYVIHVGRAARQKRHDVLLEAFKSVPERYRLVLLAPNPDRLRRWVTERGLADRVVIPEFQQNPYPWIAGARLLALSSDFEGLSLVCIEALACGTPVVATDCPHGPSEVLSGNLSRWLVPVGDSGALAAKINEALETEIDVSNPEILNKVRPEVVAAQYLSLAGNHAQMSEIG